MEVGGFDTDGDWKRSKKNDARHRKLLVKAGI